MDLTPYVDDLRDELLTAADDGQAVALARRLAASVASATRLTMLDVLSVAAREITRELAPGSVEVRLEGRNPYFVVTPPFADEPADTAPDPQAGPGSDNGAGWAGAISRINFRPPEQLKQHIEAAAAAEGLSVNAWLVRATTDALAAGPDHRRARRGGKRDGQFVGWVG